MRREGEEDREELRIKMRVKKDELRNWKENSV